MRVIGPTLHKTDWQKFKSVAHKNQVLGERAQTTLFERYKPGSLDRVQFTHLVYDTYIPTVEIQIAMHCTGCKSGKSITMRVPPDVVAPSKIIEYKCANCSWRKTKREDVLSKRHRLAYGSYRAMTSRCTCTANTDYQHYGGRGIAICPRWRGKHGFANFLADMGDRTADLSIDRIDVNGNYTPQNCRWADAKTQSLNKRNTVADVESLRNFDNDILEDGFSCRAL